MCRKSRSCSQSSTQGEVCENITALPEAVSKAALLRTQLFLNDSSFIFCLCIVEDHIVGFINQGNNMLSLD